MTRTENCKVTPFVFVLKKNEIYMGKLNTKLKKRMCEEEDYQICFLLKKEQ